jgi:hypothetical protein
MGRPESSVEKIKPPGGARSRKPPLPAASTISCVAGLPSPPQEAFKGSKLTPASNAKPQMKQ